MNRQRGGERKGNGRGGDNNSNLSQLDRDYTILRWIANSSVFCGKKSGNVSLIDPSDLKYQGDIGRYDGEFLLTPNCALVWPLNSFAGCIVYLHIKK